MNTVTNCIKAKDWTKDGKTVPIYTVTLSDGRSGQSFGTEIPAGTPETELLITEGEYGLKIKLNKPKNGFFKPGLPKGNESFALSYAKDYAVAMIASGKDFKSELITQLADKFYDWLESKRK